MPINPCSLHDLTPNVPPAASHLAAAATATATDPRGTEVGWMPHVDVWAVPYAIRIPSPAGEVVCPRCREVFLAVGPTGHAGDQPICDLCFLEGSQPLGMLLALAAVARAFGALGPRAGRRYLEASEELAAFARIYDIVANKSGPARPFRIPDLEL